MGGEDLNSPIPLSVHPSEFDAEHISPPLQNASSRGYRHGQPAEEHFRKQSRRHSTSSAQPSSLTHENHRTAAVENSEASTSGRHTGQVLPSEAAAGTAARVAIPLATPPREGAASSSSEHEAAQNSEEGQDASSQIAPEKLDSTAAIALGIESLMGPAIRECSSSMAGAFSSQQELAAQIDRLTAELDAMLDKLPLHVISQPAARLTGVSRRVQALSTTLHTVQGRMTNIHAMLDKLVSAAKKSSPSPSSEAHPPELALSLPATSAAQVSSRSPPPPSAAASSSYASWSPFSSSMFSSPQPPRQNSPTNVAREVLLGLKPPVSPRSLSANIKCAGGDGMRVRSSSGPPTYSSQSRAHQVPAVQARQPVGPHGSEQLAGGASHPLDVGHLSSSEDASATSDADVSLLLSAETMFQSTEVLSPDSTPGAAPAD
eukprot:jgi/Mesen1/3247/ME000187S02404